MKAPYLRFIILAAFCFSLFGCATDPTTGKLVLDKVKARRVAAAVGSNILSDGAKLAVGALVAVVSDASHGDTNRSDLQQAAATGAWQSIGEINVADDVRNIVAAWNGGSAPNVATKASAVYTAINPQTDQQKKDAVNLIATTISTVADPNAPVISAGAAHSAITMATSPSGKAIVSVGKEGK